MVEKAFQCTANGRGEFFLKGDGMGNIAIELFRPGNAACRCVHKANRGSDEIRVNLDAAFEPVVNVGSVFNGTFFVPVPPMREK